MQDYVLHYLDLFDQLKIGRMHLVGSSFGGWLAAELALVQQERLAGLTLIAPGGLAITEPPSVDLFTVPPAKLLSYLVNDQDCLKPFLPQGHDLEFMTLRYRETTSTARLTWENPAGNRKLAQWLHRIRTPTLLLWGERDRIKPVRQAEIWQDLLPNAQLEVVPNVGHLVLEEKPAAAEIVSRFFAKAEKA